MNLKDLKNKYLIITGDKNSGKTSFIKDLVSHPNNKYYSFGGILTAKEFKGNEPFNYYAVELNSGNRALLCTAEQIYSLQKAGKYYFFDEGIDFGNKSIEKSIKNNADYIVIDEIGPLEINGNGWNKSLMIMLTAPSNFILSVRKSLVQSIIQKYNIQDYSIIDISDTNA